MSTLDQNLKNQEPELRAWLKVHGGKSRVIWYRDRVTGGTMDRPGMEKLLRDMNAGEISTVLVWRIDRVGRGARDLLSFFDDLESRGIVFVSLRDGVDARTAAGKMFRHMLVGFAQYERELLGERVRAGQRRARAAGKRWGGRRPGQRTRLTPKKLETIATLLNHGKLSKAEIARQVEISERSVYRAAEIIARSA